MRGLRALARLVRSIVRASSMSSMVRPICRNSALAVLPLDIGSSWLQRGAGIFFQSRFGQSSEANSAFNGFSRIVMVLSRPCQQALNTNISVQVRPVDGRAADFESLALLRRGQRKRRVKRKRHADETPVFQMETERFIIHDHVLNSRWYLHWIKPQLWRGAVRQLRVGLAITLQHSSDNPAVAIQCHILRQLADTFCAPVRSHEAG
jgi:hypothetical protein